MKLEKELREATKRFKQIDKGELINSIKTIVKDKNYKNLETRILWLCLHAVYTDKEIVNLMEAYKCNDSHIETLARNAFKVLDIDLKTFEK